MGDQAPGTEKRPKTQKQEGTNNPGSKDRNRSGQGQMEQTGRQHQPGGSQRSDKPHDSDPGKSTDKERDRGHSGASRPER